MRNIERLFGTDGIRGRANVYPMTAEMAMRLGMSAGSLLKKDGYRNRVIIAKDTRLSGYMIESALTAGFISVGIDVMLVGPMPTPAVSMLIKAMRADMGVMISASHNPYHDNGLKIFDHKGIKLSDEVEDRLQQTMTLQDLSHLLVDSEDLGRARRLEDAPGRYIEYAKTSFPKERSLEGLKIVIDCANGGAYHLAPTIFWELGAEVVKIACEPNGLNINEQCGAMHPEGLTRKVKEVGADIGIALDGDADRIVICDQQGEVVAGDHLLGAIATHLHYYQKLKNNGVVITHMSNMALEHYLNSIGLQVWRTQIGDRYVFARMQQEACSFGGEQSGHIISGKCATTGDGIISALQLLSYLVEHRLPASSLHNLFSLYPQVLRNVRHIQPNTMESIEFKQSMAQLQTQYPHYRFLIRKSGTEPLLRIMIEGEDKKTAAYIAKTLEESALGLHQDLEKV